MRKLVQSYCSTSSKDVRNLSKKKTKGSRQHLSQLLVIPTLMRPNGVHGVHVIGQVLALNMLLSLACRLMAKFEHASMVFFL